MINTAVVYALLGVVLCLFGFALYWGGMRLVGMFMGGSIAALVGIILAYVTGMERTLALAIIAILGLVGIGVGWRLFKGAHGFLVFIIGAGLGYLIVKVVLAPYYGGVWAQPWMPVVSIVAGGVLGLLLFRYVIILVTSAAGAYLLYLSTNQPWILFVAFFVGLLAQIGLFHRFRLNRKVRIRWS
jgi:hypothetical protein